MSEDNDNLRRATFKINSTKLFLLLVTLSVNNDIKLLEGFQRTVFWNKYRSEIKYNQETTI